MIKKITLYFILASSIMGCASQTPEPMSHFYDAQKKLQSAGHWNVLAKDMANKVAGHLKEKNLTGHPIFLARNASHISFNRAFNEFLISHLFNAGVDITGNANAPDTLVLSYSTQLLDHHDPKYTKPPSGVLSFISQSIWARSDWAATENPWLGGLPLLGIGLGEELVGGMYWNNQRYWDENNVPNSELIINVSLQLNDKYVLRKVAIYYVSDAHFSYATTYNQSLGGVNVKTKTYRVVNQ